MLLPTWGSAPFLVCLDQAVTLRLFCGRYGDTKAWVYEPELVTIQVLLRNATALPGPVDVLFRIDTSDVRKPVPGGCCLTCQVSANDPTMIMRILKEENTILKFSRANLAPAFPRSLSGISGNFGEKAPCQCDYAIAASDPDESGNYAKTTLTYTLFQLPISDCGSDFKRIFSQVAMFRALDRMSTVAGLLKYGTQIGIALPAHKETQFKRDQTAGSGLIYNVLVTDEEAFKIAEGIYACGAALVKTCGAARYSAAVCTNCVKKGAKLLSGKCSVSPR